MAGLFVFGGGMTRVAVFIDYQNVYMGARKHFALPMARFTEGQIDPMLLGRLLVARGQTIDERRHLEIVRVFRGEPSSTRSPHAHSAWRRQSERWLGTSDVSLTARPLHYRSTGRVGGIEQFQVSEKGIDVLIALGIAIGAERDEYDVCVLFSADTDLLPALEHARSLGKRIEVAAWHSGQRHPSRLTLPGIWCHYLSHADYEHVADRTDYTQ